MACKGLATLERPHRRAGYYKLPDEFKVVSQELLTELAAQSPKKSHKRNDVIRHTACKPNRASVARARAYLAKMDPAISGENGRNQLLSNTTIQAIQMVKDFY